MERRSVRGGRDFVNIWRREGSGKEKKANNNLYLDTEWNTSIGLTEEEPEQLMPRDGLKLIY
jgi:hypothetical protein